MAQVEWEALKILKIYWKHECCEEAELPIESNQYGTGTPFIDFHGMKQGDIIEDEC